MVMASIIDWGISYVLDAGSCKESEASRGAWAQTCHFKHDRLWVRVSRSGQRGNARRWVPSLKTQCLPGSQVAFAYTAMCGI